VTLLLAVAGAARSGTAGLAHAMASLLTLPLAQAGAELPLLCALQEAAARRATEVARVFPGQPPDHRPPEALLDAALRNLPATGVLRVAELLPDAAMLRGLGTVLEARPQARALCVWRHGIGFVDSRRRALPHLSFAEHCRVWAASQDAVAALRQRFGARVMVVEHREMAEAAETLAQRLARFCEVPESSMARLPALLSGAAGPPPPSLAATRWNAPEVEIFAGFCGAAMTLAGYPLDLAAAIRARPLDLLRAIRTGGARSEGAMRLAMPQGHRGGVLLRMEAEGPGRLRLPALAPAGRDRLQMHLTAAGQPLLLELRLEGSLTRRPLMLRPLRLSPGENAEIEARLPASDELLDLVVSAAPAAGAAFELRSAILSVA
jgi:hypothetical protein